MKEKHKYLSYFESQWLSWFRSGHLPLNDRKFKQQQIKSPLCICEKANEDRDHFLFYCENWSKQRKKHLEPIIKKYIQPQHTLEFLVEENDGIRKLLDFIKDTKRFGCPKMSISSEK